MAVQEQEFKVECGCGKKLIFKKRNSKKKVVCGDRGTTIQQVRVLYYEIIQVHDVIQIMEVRRYM